MTTNAAVTLANVKGGVGRDEAGAGGVGKINTGAEAAVAGAAAEAGSAAACIGFAVVSGDALTSYRPVNVSKPATMPMTPAPIQTALSGSAACVLLGGASTSAVGAGFAGLDSLIQGSQGAPS